MAIPAEKMATYREGLRRRLSRPLTETERSKLDKAHAEAERLAQKLVKEHGARRVLLFGSVARRRPLRADAAIDLAVEGMSPEDDYWMAVDLRTGTGRGVDHVRLASTRPSVHRITVL